MVAILFIIWLVLGVLGTMRMYYSFIKSWYISFGTDYRKSETRSGLNLVLIASPALIAGGLITFAMVGLMSITILPKGESCWYFKIPEKNVRASS